MDHLHDTIRAITWHHDRLLLLDQRRLPAQQTYVELDDAAAVASAIRDMVVRGAPAIGIAAAYGVVLAARRRLGEAGSRWKQAIEADLQQLAVARPTAVNLCWALERMRGVIAEVSATDAVDRLSAEARCIHDEDIDANRRMGELGAALIETPCSVLTHCNTGSLATGGYGTALGVIRSAYAAGRVQQVFADETRPWLQGARLTAWELVQDGIPVQLLVDSAAPYLMAGGQVGWVITGADRITANGDVANKIGTYAAAVAARHHGVGFMVVAPTSTVDMSLASGKEIPIETRAAEEVLGCAGQPVAAAGAGAWNPVFDVTPAELIDAVVTERGVVRHPDREGMAALMGRR
ncbi:MAG: S-methyl-5-thioribose-1-phosphate isomerase [Gammaproteobacteria bacterium]